jgi:hypothetical protein
MFANLRFYTQQRSPYRTDFSRAVSDQRAETGSRTERCFPAVARALQWYRSGTNADRAGNYLPLPFTGVSGSSFSRNYLVEHILNERPGSIRPMERYRPSTSGA